MSLPLKQVMSSSLPLKYQFYEFTPLKKNIKLYEFVEIELDPTEKKLNLTNNLWNCIFPIPMDNYDSLFEFRMWTRDAIERFRGATLYIDNRPISTIDISNNPDSVRMDVDGTLLLNFLDKPLLLRSMYDHNVTVVVYLHAIQVHDINLKVVYGQFNTLQALDFSANFWEAIYHNAQGQTFKITYDHGKVFIHYPRDSGDPLIRLKNQNSLSYLYSEFYMPKITTLRM